MPFVKKQKPPPKETPAAKKPEPKVTTEFDDMLDMLDTEDITELACRWSLWVGFCNKSGCGRMGGVTIWWVWFFNTCVQYYLLVMP